MLKGWIVSFFAIAPFAMSVAQAAEGGFSHYLPGVVGDIALAQPPAPGFLVANTIWYQTGDESAALLQGRLNLDLDTTTVLNVLITTYTLEPSVLGGTYTVGAVVPFGYANLEATISSPGLGSVSASEGSFNLSDVVFIPVQLNWQAGNFSFKAAQSIIAPTGAYSLDETVNLGRNYWTFNTNLAMTWLNTETGTEASIAPGIMINTENPDTNYRTGTEFHVDATVNQFVTPQLALGLRGYYYTQITDDSGSGATLGGFRSESLGIGPGFVWSPESAGGRLSLYGKWMHDLYANNRFKSDHVTVGGAWKF